MYVVLNIGFYLKLCADFQHFRIFKHQKSNKSRTTFPKSWYKQMLYVNTLWMRYCHKGKSSANKLITLVKLPLINSVSFDWAGWIKLRHCDGTTENQRLMLQHRWNNISPIKSLCYQNFIVSPPPPPPPFHVWFNQNNIEIEFSVFFFSFTYQLMKH